MSACQNPVSPLVPYPASERLRAQLPVRCSPHCRGEHGYSRCGRCDAAQEALEERAREDATALIARADVLTETVLADVPEGVRELVARVVVRSLNSDDALAHGLREALLDELAPEAMLRLLADREAA